MGKGIKAGDVVRVTRDHDEVKFKDEIVVEAVEEETFFLRGRVRGKTKGKAVKAWLDDVVKEG